MAAAVLATARRRVPMTPAGPTTDRAAVRAGAAVLGAVAGLVGVWFIGLPVVAWPATVAGGSVIGGLIGARMPDPVDTLRARRVTLDLPLALELLAACVGAGSVLRHAVTEVADVVEGPVGDDLRGLVRAVGLGTDEAAAWRALSQRPGWSPVARQVASGIESGAAVADLMVRCAADARRAARAVRTTAARTVGVRSVLPLMLCYLPAFLLIGVVPIIGALLTGLTGL